ncbi:MAG: shikimate dehydrogenase [Endomicrobium sp.]|jgi:shikimate dehydrogenase|nr:shikimate dehydrogenase [Endomicrobium sp.]
MKRREKNLTINNETKLFAILGYPIKHSFSPLMQNAWFKKENLNCAYMSFETEPKKLKKTIEAVKVLGFCGINITIPHKTSIMKFLDHTDKASKFIGSVNTIVIKNGRLCGYNTDHLGFSADLISKNVKIKEKTVFIFGAGGAARAVIYSAKSGGAKKIYLANRTYKTAAKLAKEFKIEAIRADDIPEKIAKSDLIINASACGMKKTDTLPFKINILKEDAVIYDLIYNKPTPFMKAAKEHKIKFYTGEGMLINQGACGFKIWTGIYPDVKSAIKLLNKFMR